MKPHAILALLIIAGLGLIFVSCDLQTETTPPLGYPPAGHLVINEVYTLPATHPNAHSWVEIFNPTDSTFLMRGWSLTYRTTMTTTTRYLYTDSAKTGYRRDSLISQTIDTSLISRRVPFAPQGQVRVKPGEFLTLVSDLERLRVYTNLGPGSGPVPTSNSQFRASDTVRINRVDSLRFNTPDTVRSRVYPFFLQKSDELILRDPAGTVVDVVRFGNYVSPAPDPYPANQSFGLLSDFESIARYAGAYSTKNTANDFYMTSGVLRPIPHWISQQYKQ